MKKPEYLPGYIDKGATKSDSIGQCSEIFIVQLKLFYNNRTKISKRVKFDENDIYNICGNNDELVSVIVHIGKSIESGHYICYCKYGTTWFTYSDDKVESGIRKSRSGTPYMFFFRRLSAATTAPNEANDQIIHTIKIIF